MQLLRKAELGRQLGSRSPLKSLETFEGNNRSGAYYFLF